MSVSLRLWLASTAAREVVSVEGREVESFEEMNEDEDDDEDDDEEDSSEEDDPAEKPATEAVEDEER